MRKPKAEKITKDRKQDHLKLNMLYLFLALSVVGYVLLSNPIIGAIAFILLIFTLIEEFRQSVNDEGLRKSLYDVIAAVAIIVVIWILLVIILGTSSPINVVASCSMLPTLHRGDLIILHGISNMTTFLQSNKIPVVPISQLQMSALQSSMNSEFLAFFAYNASNPSQISEIFGQPNLPIALYNTRCIDTFESTGQYSRIKECMVSSQGSNLIQYNYSIVNVSIGGGIAYSAQTNQISIANTSITENYSNPIIVYKTTSNDSFTGDIIHRLVAAIKVGNQYYLLTKGDNNPGLDIQFINYPIVQSDVAGSVVYDVPAVGYLRLIVSGMFATPPGCNSTILR